MMTIYLHGLPGGPDELALFGDTASASPRILAPDRGRIAGSLDSMLASLVDEIDRRNPDAPLRIVGFSLGARVALELAARLGARVGELHLVSAAAPLACGVDLADMAGGPLFRLARDAPRRFAAVTAAQGLAARIAPGLMARAIFASAAGEDRALRDDPHFAAIIRRILRTSLVEGAASYRRELSTYVLPWESLVAQVRAPATLWHGTEDNWSPPIMAHWLAETLPNVAAVNMLPGKSHYSTLAHALSTID